MKKIILIFVLLIMVGCKQQIDQTEKIEPEIQGNTNNEQLANPASVYCEDNGGSLEIRTAADRSQTGFCTLPDGTVCEEWAYYRGECLQSDSSELAETQESHDAMQRKFHRTFSVLMPENWAEVEYSGMIFYLPPGSEAADPTSEKVEIIGAMTPQNDTVPLKEILEAGLDETRKVVPDVEVIREEETTLGGAKALKLTTTGTIMDKKFTNTQIGTLNNNVMQNIIHNCFEDNCVYSDIYYKMVDSFQIIQENN
jgi:putative hemolysin